MWRCHPAWEAGSWRFHGGQLLPRAMDLSEGKTGPETLGPHPSAALLPTDRYSQRVLAPKHESPVWDPGHLGELTPPNPLKCNCQQRAQRHRRAGGALGRESPGWEPTAPHPRPPDRL